jgi:ankyrin repeat domain-containing protein 17
MPADSFESPLTLAACGGHVELAMLLLERGANIEEVSQYIPLADPEPELLFCGIRIPAFQVYISSCFL